jgi:hypothetical protein
MQINRAHDHRICGALLAAACCAVALAIPTAGRAADPVSSSCHGDDTGLTLPAGFCATLFADGIGHARHLVVADSGVVYVNTW